MTTAASVALAVAALAAAADWWAVACDSRRTEYVAKPATLLALIACALLLDPASAAQRTAFVVALACSLVGDVFLMLPTDRFLAGLAAFLVAHVAFVVGFVVAGLDVGALVVAALAVLATATVLGTPVVRAVRRSDPRLFPAVLAYGLSLAAMVACAWAGGPAAARAGSSLFLLSDVTIGWRRFVLPAPWMPLAVIVTYHVGQAALVLSLAP